jgi:hypothetical protein
MTGAEIYKPNQNVVVTELDDDESVLLDLNTRRYYTVNETGVLIWAQLKEGKGILEICNVVAGEFEISADDASTFVEVFISSLEKEGLVTKE